MRLLLESTLALDGQFGSHLVGWAWAKMCFVEERVGVESSESIFDAVDGFTRGCEKALCSARATQCRLWPAARTLFPNSAPDVAGALDGFESWHCFA